MLGKSIIKTLRISFYITLVSTLGCNLINPSETIPTRIKLEPFNLEVSSGQGSAQNEITEIWVYANQNLVGVYSPTSEVDYIGNHIQTQFSFYPGIRNNGIAMDAIIYPLYTPYQITLPNLPDSIVHIFPTTAYKSTAVISLNSDFEEINDFVFNIDSLETSFVSRSMTDPFEGNYSGQIVLSQEAYYIEVGNSITLNDLPTDGTPAYLEFNYKSDVEVDIGLQGISLNGQSFNHYFFVTKPSESWKKLHIELTNQLMESGFPSYRIVFRSFFPNNSSLQELKIELDNIKVIHL